MELELGLALPSSNAPSKGIGFDLNGDDACATTPAVHKKKRVFADAFGGDRVTLPLFVWEQSSTHANSNRTVGWPPVKSSWRNSGGGARYVKVKMEGVAIGRKVDLSLHRSYAALVDALDRLFTRNHEDGVVVQLQGLCGDAPPGRHHRTFTYQVGNGDWMLLGDVPWEKFVKSVKRLKIVTN